MAGSEEAKRRLHINVPAEEIVSIARRTYEDMRSAGYAHIDPENEFVEGFLTGFNNARYVGLLSRL